ncbi:MAG: DUF3943 domain-containing protein [Acidobacteria bacterium]|nr:DUF3943 domain-containing protein [Acidobacteriota bacterium]
MATPVLTLTAPSAQAQAPPGAQASSGVPIGFSGTIGYGGAGGDFGSFLDAGWTWDFAFFVEAGAFRFGVGTELSGYESTRAGAYEKWSVSPFHGFVGWTAARRAAVRSYILARVGSLRVRPFVEPERTGGAVNGWSLSLVPGVEVPLREFLSLDLSLALTRNAFEDAAFGGEGSAPVSSGTTWSARAGLTWRPGRAPTPGTAFTLPATEPWGVTPDFGLAAGELLVVLTLGSVDNEYVRDARWAQVSPQTWWTNLKRGFGYDGNKFDTNHLYHPWNGASYFSTGRSNGLGFWPSVAFAATGSLLWECCGEVQQMSLNDLVSTALGGVAVGEALHRVASVVLDNRDRGVTRALREAGVLLMDPVRGVNRVVSPSRLRAPNPAEPFDWRPPQLGALFALGARRVDPGPSSSEDVETDPFADLTVRYTSVIDNERRRPFDSFDARFQLNLVDRLEPVCAMVVRGDLASWSLGDPGRGAFALTQHSDYFNDRSFEFGAQSFGVSLACRVAFSDSTRLVLRGDVLGTVQGVVAPDLQPAAETTVTPEGRRHDYGPGLGAFAEARLVTRNVPRLEAYYRYQWIHVINDTATIGGATDHQVQLLGGRLHVPSSRAWVRASRASCGSSPAASAAPSSTSTGASPTSGPTRPGSWEASSPVTSAMGKDAMVRSSASSRQ